MLSAPDVFAVLNFFITPPPFVFPVSHDKRGTKTRENKYSISMALGGHV